MKRQKVKGTGHKQPADANTEPNFYSMPPVQAAPSPPPAATRDNGFRDPQTQPGQQLGPPASQQSPGQAALSPGIQSVHGAAHLLRGIATGQPYQGLVLPTLPFVGLPQAAAAPPASADSDDDNGGRSTSYQNKKTPSQHQQRGASFLPRHE